MHVNRRLIAAAFAAAGLSSGGASHATNWVMAYGTEPATSTHRLLGAVQLTYENNFDCKEPDGLVGGAAVNNGGVVNNCRQGPELRDDESGLALQNLMLGARGNLIPGRINYHVAVNAGQNAANYKPYKTEREHLASLVGASVSFHYIPGVRIRAGLQQKPGPEELYQGLEATDYIFLTDFVQRVQIERFIDGNAKSTAPIAGQGFAGNVSRNGYDTDVGRDWGVQFFDAFKRDKWTHTYSVMFANGNGIHRGDNNSDKDLNLYLSSEYDLPGGKGPLKHGVKLYGYHQKGVRNFVIDAAGTQSQDFDRIRYGIGAKAIGHLFGEDRGKHRLGFELMFADGMINYTPTANMADAPFGGLIQFAAEEGNKAKGITLDYGYYLNKNWQFDVRYSRDNLLYEQANANNVPGSLYWTSGDERILKYTTLGVNYYFAPKTRLTFNYEFRNVTAPNPARTLTGAISGPSTVNANEITGSVGDRVGLRLTHSF
jgi:hypothetical protein